MLAYFSPILAIADIDSRKFGISKSNKKAPFPLENRAFPDTNSDSQFLTVTYRVVRGGRVVVR